MRTTASFAATPRPFDWQSVTTTTRTAEPFPPRAWGRVPSGPNPVNNGVRHTEGEPVFFRSVFWERTVFSLLEKVERLPPSIQGEIATRVGNYINFARTARDEATMTRFIEATAGERAKVASSTVDPRWTAPALAEAWCISRLGLSNGNLNRYSAMSVITAIEAFTSERAA
jgi:hypothetical protein